MAPFECSVQNIHKQCYLNEGCERRQLKTFRLEFMLTPGLSERTQGMMNEITVSGVESPVIYKTPTLDSQPCDCRWHI